MELLQDNGLSHLCKPRMSMAQHVDDLPEELMAHIFLMGAQPTEHVPSGLPYPVLVSHVSRRWRHLTTTLPALWSDIPIRSSRPLHLPSLYLSRSSPCTFDLSIRIPSFFAYPQLRTALDLIAPHISRLRRLRVDLALRFGADSVLSEILAYLGTYSTPSLESLELRADTPLGQAGHKAPRLVTRSSSRLTSLMLSSVPLNWELSLFGDLTSLALTFERADGAPTFDELRQIARMSPLLATLSLEGAGLDVQDAASAVEPIEMRSLRSLSVCLKQGPKYARVILPALSAPSLERLKLSDASRETWEALLETACTWKDAHLFPVLRTLSLHETPTLLTRDLARAMPAIETLVIGCSELAELREFIVHEVLPGADVEESKVWPRLQNVQYEDGPYDMDLISVLHDMVGSRNRQSSSLASD
ncbi:hypothetical protein DENSPDRAFT_845576 [Dentipellis sp. KUC8613]|nr:hypothetical protein DENSPDRAFT_845576 [Dentipellis sp. KUC8613]